MEKYTIENLDLYYGGFKALKNINLKVKEKEITAFIGSHQDAANPHF